jgi:pyruvate/2-oxoglutarate dehydrogenase complex dihydrolipoamide dehydrogenase (E3) component
MRQAFDVVCLAEGVVTKDSAATARGYILDFHGGTVKLVADRAQGILVGATLVTPGAVEIIGELVLAIKARTPLAELTDAPIPFPRSTACSARRSPISRTPRRHD